jgi:GT2 family glycosyltransferase
MSAYPEFEFVFNPRALGFTAAVRAGLRQITADWTYLLNSDVLLSEDALSALLEHRAPDVFSLASSIRMTTKDSAHETNRTALRLVDGLAMLVELDAGVGTAVDHFYSGGGSSLFQTSRLRYVAGLTECYAPFYWEDAEWGALSRAMGLRNLFVPQSQVQHEGRATIRRFYDAAEVSRIYERNRVQFQLRCIPDADTPAVRERMRNASWRTLLELLHPSRMWSMARVRASLVGGGFTGR